LMDLQMPEMNGFERLNILEQQWILKFRLLH
jgi:CheY-like chemotaxis protein